MDRLGGPLEGDDNLAGAQSAPLLRDLVEGRQMGDVSSSRLRKSQELDPRDRGRMGGDCLPNADRRLDTADRRRG